MAIAILKIKAWVLNHAEISVVQAGGLEPPAYFLGGSRSILMSYACIAK